MASFDDAEDIFTLLWTSMSFDPILVLVSADFCTCFFIISKIVWKNVDSVEQWGRICFCYFSYLITTEDYVCIFIIALLSSLLVP